MVFLTVREAAERIGKSPSSIRRLIYPIIKADDHPDRALVQPNVEDAMKLRMSGESFPWKVNEELLSRVDVSESSTAHSPTSNIGKGGSSAEAELLQMLRQELDIKNRQISQQTEVMSKQVELIAGLSERIREGNLLMATVQKQWSLSDGRDEKPKHVVEAKSSQEQVEVVEKDESKKGATKTESTSGSSKKPIKKGLFTRLFR